MSAGASTGNQNAHGLFLEYAELAPGNKQGWVTKEITADEIPM
jgi:hypothetical protein